MSSRHRSEREGILTERDALARLARALDPEHADDLVQETLLSAVARPPPEAAERGPWLRGVLRNLWRMRSRGARRRTSREEAAGLGSALATPEDLARESERNRRIHALVRELPAPLRGIVELRYFEGLTAAEIATRRGLPPGTVRRRLKTALDQLRARPPSDLLGVVPFLPEPASGAAFAGAGAAVKLSGKLGIVGILTTLCALLVLFRVAEGSEEAETAASVVTLENRTAPAGGPRASTTPEPDGDPPLRVRRPDDKRAARARRDVLLAQIVDALHRKGVSREYPGPTVEGEMDPDYAEDRLRNDLIPEARGCYNEVLLRDGAYAGTIVLDFTIVADEQLGGVIERVELGEGTTIDDTTMLECMQDATYAMTFDPPAGGGRVEVHHPMVFEPGD